MRRWSAICGLVLGVVGMGGAPAGAGAETLKPVEITVIETTPAFQDLPLLAMEEIAPRYSLKITASQFQGGGEAGSVFVGGRGDVLLAGVDKVFGMNKQGVADVKTFGTVLTKGGWALVVPGDSPVKEVAELKGKTIGISGPGASSDAFLRWGLRKAGLNPDKDVSIVALGSMASLQAGIENHKVEASMLASPALLTTVAAKTARVIGPWDKLDYPGDVFIARSKDLEARRDDFARFMSVFKLALDRMKNDRAYAEKIARGRYPNMSDADLKANLDYHYSTIWEPMDGAITKKQYDNAKDVLVGAGRIPEVEFPPYEKVVVTLPAVDLPKP